MRSKTAYHERVEVKRDTASGTGEPRTLALAGALILAEISLTVAGAFAIFLALTLSLGHQPQFALPLWARFSGAIAIAAAVALFADTFRYRNPREMLISTSVTLRKLLGREPISVPAGRDEPFVVSGPYRYVRNPLYLGVVLSVVGFGFIGSSVVVFLWAFVLLCWYWFLLIPFEERELYALFGETYARYRQQVPKLFPYWKRYVGPEGRR